MKIRKAYVLIPFFTLLLFSTLRPSFGLRQLSDDQCSLDIDVCDQPDFVRGVRGDAGPQGTRGPVGPRGKDCSCPGDLQNRLLKLESENKLIWEEVKALIASKNET